MSVFGSKGANLLKVALLAAVMLAACLLLALGSNEEALATPGDLDPTFDGTAPAGTVARSVDAGDYHTCGVRTDGTVACWGYNATGESSPPAGTFTAVSAGNFHSCGVKTDGTIACWGDDLYGESSPPAGTFSAVSAGNFYTCGVRTDGTLACWGSNGSGKATPPSGTFSAVSAGDQHTCGVRIDGTLACWGSNYFGESSPPAGTFTAVGAGNFHTCAVKTDGTLACWGENLQGESTPPPGTFSGVGTGDRHTCGVRIDGTIVCWGSNDHGQTNAPSGTFSAVSVGLFHNCAVKTDGTIACWGDNGAGQLGAAPADPSPAPPAGQVGTAYSHTFTSSAGSPVSSFSVSAGALPPGLTLSSDGVLSGTPTTGGEYTFTVTASNGLFADASQQFTIIVSPSKLTDTDGDGIPDNFDACPNEAAETPDGCPPDITPPDGTVSVNGGAAYTRSATVNLTLSASDQGTGVSEMRLSNNGTTWADWEPYATSKSWTLTSGDGTKTVHVQYRDSAGNISTIARDAIKLDTARPGGTVAINGGAASTGSRSVSLTLSASDPIPASGVAKMRFRNENTTTWSSWQTYSTSKAWTLSAGGGTKTVYVQYRDRAGNVSLAARDSITYQP